MTNGELNQAVTEMLTGGKRMAQTDVNRLVLSMLADIRARQKDIIEAQQDHARRVKALEDASIVFFIRAHKKTSAIIFIAGLFVLNAWFVSGWRQPLIKAMLGMVGIDIPEELIP